jgi:hypothetical protein
MVYIRKDLEASQKLLKDEEHPDICMVTLRTNHGPLDVINIYNAGPGSERTNEAVEHVMEYQALGEGLICGDFNLHHGHWDPNATRDDAIADRLVDWLLDRSVVLLTDPQVPTRGEAVLDLTMATNNLYRRTRVEAYSFNRAQRVTGKLRRSLRTSKWRRMVRFSLPRIFPRPPGTGRRRAAIGP